MSDEQAIAVARCMRELVAERLNPVWHFNTCGCCVTVHDDVKPVEYGYVINQRGEAFWEKVAH
jgi:hypothetical protein